MQEKFSILVIEAATEIKNLLSVIISNMGNNVFFVDSSNEAADHLQNDEISIDLIIIDENSSQWSKHQTSARIRNIIKTSYIPILFLTDAKSSIEVVKHCLSYGNDYIAIPSSDDLIKAKIQANLDTRGLYRQLETQHSELQEHRSAIEREHQIVETIFSHHSKRHITKSENLQFHISSASVFNGDVLLTAIGPSGSIYIAIGDVTGHGLAAAVAAIPVYPTFRTMAHKGFTVGKIAYEMNCSLKGLLPDHMMLAATILELNAAGDQLTIWSGGMPPLIHENGQGEIKQTISPAHMPLGILSEHEFDQSVNVVDVNRDDRIYLFTDGIEESRNASKQMFGSDRLYNLFDCSDNNIYQRLLDELSIFTQDTEQDDDITLVELTCLPNIGENTTQQATNTEIQSIPWELAIELNHTQLRTIEPIPQIIRLLDKAAGVDVHQDYISTILSELYSNALEHGILGLDSSLKDTDEGFVDYYQQRREKLEALVQGNIHINIALIPNETGHKITISITDSGAPFIPTTTQKDDHSDDTHGRGMTLLKALCESINYSNNNKTVTAIYQI